MQSPNPMSKKMVTATEAVRLGKTYSEQILEPSQVHEFHSILKVHVKNMIILFYTELVYYAFIQPWWNPVPNLR
jgi:hypothetical protein